MAKELQVKMREAYDTEQNWRTNDPVLLSGQLAFSSDKYGRYKIGDGTHTWSQLEYAKLGWDDITGKPATFNPPAHNHTISQVTDISNASVKYAKTAGAASSVAWANVAGKPATFPADSHTHDDRYYTETEINNKLSGYATSGHTHSGYAASSHTHNYAGSSSVGGAANTAVALTTNGGSATQPVYFANGKPVACTYTLGKSVPSNAVFTDTNTWIAFKGATTTAAGTAGYAPAPSAGAANRYLRSDGQWVVPPNTTYSLGSFGITATAAELNYCDGVTSNIQTQLNGKAASSHTHSGYAASSHSHTASQITGLPNVVAITNTQIDSLKNL